MNEKKRFQSGREIFEAFIPDYVTSDTEQQQDASNDVEQLVEAILGDFSANFHNLVETQDGTD
ncbi:MAG: hypothetical protein OXE50_16080 [Chloroflexi bacterium]|nr:hypothetical protein [Chloroflexota bacterium]